LPHRRVNEHSPFFDARPVRGAHPLTIFVRCLRQLPPLGVAQARPVRDAHPLTIFVRCLRQLPPLGVAKNEERFFTSFGMTPGRGGNVVGEGLRRNPVGWKRRQGDCQDNAKGASGAGRRRGVALPA
jgi:hypothetical protein